MSINPFNKTNRSQQQQNNPQHPRNYRWGLRQVRRGPDKKLHFAGQEQDETVTKVVRKHPWFLVRPVLPVLGFFFLLIFLFAVDLRLTDFHALWVLLEIATIVALILSIAWFIYNDLVLWWIQTTIITDKRIINWGTRKGSFFQPTRKETPIDKVTQVAVDRDNPWDIMLNYGTVHIYIVGGEIRLEDIPNPKGVRDAIQDISEQFKAKKPPKEKPPIPADNAMAAVLAELGKPDEIDKLTDVDEERYGPANPAKLRGPRRTFGGPLRLPLDIRYGSDEFTVMYLLRSPFVLVERLILPVLLLIIALTITFVNPSVEVFTSICVLILLLATLLAIISYIDDIYILTNKRIIDVDRKFVFLEEIRVETEYKNIRDIKVEVKNPIQYFLGIGNVEIETPGNSPNIVFEGVSHPFFIQDRIYYLKDHKEKADKTKDKNERKEQLQLWFGKVLTTLETRAQARGVPDLQRLDYWSAAERARQFGMRVVLKGEDPSYPQLAPGLVVEQNPPPGTLMSDGGEIYVLLSKRS